MPRPKKCRRICALPQCGRFGPLDTAAEPESRIKMTLDEYETIRLIDPVGLHTVDAPRGKRYNLISSHR